MDAQIAAWAERLRTAQETRTPIAPLRDEIPAGDAALAYAVQSANVAAAIAGGRRKVGPVSYTHLTLPTKRIV